MSQITHFSSVKLLAWKSGCVKFWTNIMSGRTKKMKKVVFAKKWVPEKNRFWPYLKKISHSIFGKNAVSPSIPAGTHKSSITVYIFGEELWCFPFREVPTNACFWFQFLAKKNNHVRMPSNDKFGQLLALRPIWYFTSANCLAFGQFHLCCEEKQPNTAQREKKPRA